MQCLEVLLFSYVHLNKQRIKLKADPENKALLLNFFISSAKHDSENDI